MKCIACIGNFDGVHIGHQALIEKTVKLAREKGYNAVAITFDGCKDGELTTLEQKEELLYSYGIDEVIVLEFTKDIQLMTYGVFIEFFLNRFEIDTLVCGYDFTFGNRAEGNAQKLLDYENRNFNVEIIDKVVINDRKVSSSWLKELIADHDDEMVQKLLNRDNLC